MKLVHCCAPTMVGWEPLIPSAMSSVSRCWTGMDTESDVQIEMYSIIVVVPKMELNM